MRLSIESFRFAEAILAGMGDGVISTDLEGGILYVNSAAEDIIGCKSEEVSGKEFNTIITLFDAETGEPVENPVAMALNTNAVVRLNKNTSLKGRDGRLKYVSATCSLIKASNGEATGVVVVFRDITKQRTMEIALENEDNNLRSILNGAPVGMITLDETGLIGQVNAAALAIINKKI